MNRRHWLFTAAGTAASSFAAVPAPRAPTRIIDTHTHFYDPTRPQGVPWPPKTSKLHRKVMPADWQALAKPLGIEETVVVEASPWVEDNQWLLDLAAREICIIGVVGNLDPNDPQFASNLKRFAANALFRGIRWRGDLVAIDAGKEKLVAAAKSLAEQNLALDLNGPHTILTHAASLAKQVPDLRIVIDHLGAPGDPKALKPGWKQAIAAVAKHPNVFMKVSALVEQLKGEEGKATDDARYYLPILDHLWTHFGPDRLLYGSNWPVSDRGAPYASVFKIVRDYFTSKGAAEAEKYFWKNAFIAYALTGRT